MIKSQKFSYRGMKKDVAKSNHPFDFYYEAQHIRITATDSQTTSKVSNEKGNTQMLSLPSPTIDLPSTTINYGSKSLDYSDLGTSEINSMPLTSGTQTIIGHVVTRNSIILFSTDDNGFDCIWEVEEVLASLTFDIKLLYCRSLNFSTSSPIQAIFNYENSKIQKIYWVDYVNQLRFLNLEHSKVNGDLEDLIDINSNTLNIVSNFDVSQIKITGFSGGGIHTSGMIQYAYNLYRINGSQTKISPLSRLVPLNKGTGLGGGDLNEVVGSIPLLNIGSLDTEYTHIKVYAIKYTSKNQLPTISVIVDAEIDNYTNFVYNDDGNIISDISLDTFLFLGSNPIIPKHIESKDNIMFASNIKELSFDIDFDARAYSYNSSGICRIKIDEQSSDIVLPADYLDTSKPTYNLTSDMVNPNFDTYKYQSNGSTLGGTGKFVSYNLNLKSTTANVQDKRFFKSFEIYRVGVEFYNNLGQTSLPKWVGDFKVPFCNIDGNYSNFIFSINAAGIAYLKTLGVIGYRVLRVERLESDKTIICQGVLNGMMFFDTDDAGNFARFDQYSTRKTSSENNLKLPNHLMRHFDGNTRPLRAMEHLKHLKNNKRSWDSEVSWDSAQDWNRSNSFQFNKMYQLYSPDILFGNPSFSSNLSFRILGLKRVSSQNFWGQERNTVTKLTDVEGKTSGKINVNAPGGTNLPILSNINYLQDYGLIAPSGSGDNGMDFYQYYREYLGAFVKSNNTTLYNIYGTPEITEHGAGRTLYNNNGKLAYTNSFQSVIVDDQRDDPDGSPAITSTNSYGAKCLTMVQGVDDSTVDIDTRKGLSELRTDAGITSTDGVLMCDIVRTLSNQYGGKSYEDKTRNNYIKIGDYIDITGATVSSYEIQNHGDVFVQDFNFLRVNKSELEVYDPSSFQWTEIVKFKVETSIDLKNRNDVSLSAWDGRFQPREDEFHNYNKVYSQESNLLQTQDISFKFKKVNEFDTKVLASKTKLPGEFIDSWSDFLENETLNLDGKYGPINGVVNYKDQIFVLQDEAIAKLIINPRVQVQGSDNLSIELGKGSILYDYDYVTTTSGTINKWSIIKSPTGFYYFDALNKSINKFPEAVNKGLTDIKHLHSDYEKNFNYTLLRDDNPILGKGVSGGFDLLNDDAYITLHQGGKSLTVVYNEEAKEFIDFKLYYPAFYINKGFKFLTTNSNNTELWEQGVGEYNNFYGETIPSYITLMVNPAADLDCVFNNIIYKSELYLNDVDQPTKTLTSVRLWNEYQDSGVVPLILGRNSNLRRKFRDWKVQLPREQGTRNRIRNPWVFLKLQLDNTDNYKLVLHDIIISYTI